MKIHPPLNKLVVRSSRHQCISVMYHAGYRFFAPPFLFPQVQLKNPIFFFTILIIIHVSIIVYVSFSAIFSSLEESAELVALMITVTLATARLVTPGTIIMGETKVR